MVLLRCWRDLPLPTSNFRGGGGGDDDDDDVISLGVRRDVVGLDLDNDEEIFDTASWDRRRWRSIMML
jgi:hypothetical protein